ncbi:hypothetical protein [Mycolicibacterium iranicum]|uniref:Uncharacterized protein n=1 Tax=Mycolicibacterium iranicum TaxID=912594 RepID=A0A1X1W7Q3_MYCIR|nr:hypothetical protein [Mycolicibacterium iranicum]ORV82522.1 hypothetical protein AWC12_28420 [Mycolicibacterium iranicum]
MIRTLTAVSAAALAAGLSAPMAAGQGGDQTIRVMDGQIRCLISADFEGQGRPMAICGRTDGQTFQTSPKGMNLVAVQGTGEMFYEAGAINPPPDSDVVLGPGQTYNVNGWTVRTEELRTLIYYDIGRHGISVKPVEAMAVWI